MAGDLIKRGVQFLANRRESISAQLVTITRGVDSIGNVPARIGSSDDLREDQASGMVIAKETRDYIIKATDYDFGSGPVEPLRNDLIVDSSSGTAITYRVLPITGEDAARWSDRYGTSWRIHTKRVSS